MSQSWKHSLVVKNHSGFFSFHDKFASLVEFLGLLIVDVLAEDNHFSLKAI